MIVQLPNGRIIECSLEQYLALSDDEYNELNGLSSAYTKEVGNPFYNSSLNTSTPPEVKNSIEYIEEFEPALDEMNAFEKLEDPYFHSDDI